MDAERWQRIEALLDTLLDLPSARRADVLAELCGDDAELHAEVERLLASCEAPILFPDGAAADFAAPLLVPVEDTEPQPVGRSAERIGAYRLVREIGRGGMGAVYLAERDDGEFEKRVALKLMRVGLSDDPALLRRFRKERQILATLEHPHIARLLDGGLTRDGQPFFVMEYVEGEPIDRFCNAQHLSIDARLGVFLTVCDAVEHAHRQRVVHRDLKPSNILVTADGLVKLLDFGIARLMHAEAPVEGATVLTRASERLLTPEYASPEQIRGAAASETSDVYALGVLLFELLTGVRPHRRAGRTPHELEGAILTEQPTRPSTAVGRALAGTEPGRTAPPEQIAAERCTTAERLQRRLRGDLDAIVLQALRKEPSQRYSSVEMFATDLRRHLEGLPIRARGEAPGYRLRRFVRRHRLSVGASAAGMIAGVALLSAVLASMRSPEDETGTGRPGAGQALDPGSIVVAPFENRTGDTSLDPLGILAAEWVAQALSRTALVKVIDARTALETTRLVAELAEPQPLRALAERTDAGTVVSGSYYLEGDRLRVQAQISEGRSGRLRQSPDAVFAPRDRPADALEPLRQRITGALAVLLDERLNNFTVSASQPPLYEAYQEFLLGMSEFGTDFPSAVAHFSRAARIDSTYWQAYLWEAQSHSNASDYAAADSIFSLLLPRRSQLAPYDQANLDYFHHGWVRGDWQASYDGARRMVELAPTAPHALFALGRTTSALNRCEEAVDAFGRIDLERGWGRAWALAVLRTISRCLHDMGEHERELRVAQRLRSVSPAFGWTRLPEVRALAALGRTGELMQRVEEAVAFPSTGVYQNWDPFSPGDLLHETSRELAVHGNTALAAQLLERAIAWYRARPLHEANTLTHRLELAAALYSADELDQARSIFASLGAADPTDITSTAMLALLAVRQGQFPEADSLTAVLQADDRPYRFGRATYWLARLAALQGDSAGATELLRQATREGYTRISALHLETEFVPILDYPPFRDLVRPIPARTIR